MNLDITIDDAKWKTVPQLRKLTRRAIMAALPDGDVAVSVLFTGDARILELNREWRGKASATNVLSFPSPANPEDHLGDVALAFETCQREAAEQGKPLSDHLQHLVAHGVLHLIGYDHEDDADAQVMEDLERQILESLGVSDPYA